MTVEEHQQIEAPEGSSRRVVFVTEDEVKASVGELRQEPRKDRKGRDGVLLTADQGCVIGWLLLRNANLEQALASQRGLLHAAGLEVERLRAEAARRSGGLVVPGR